MGKARESKGGLGRRTGPPAGGERFPRLRGLLVDDHPIVREGVRRQLEKEPDIEVGFETGDAGQALEWLRRERCDFAVVDISLEGRSGIDLIKDIRGRKLGFPILVLSVHDEVTYAEQVLGAGAQGFVLKQEAPGQIAEAVRRILRGEMVVGDRMAGKLFQRFASRRTEGAGDDPVSDLTPREQAVLEAVGRGWDPRKTGQALGLSASTVEKARARIKKKLFLSTGAELDSFASQWLTDLFSSGSAPLGGREMEFISQLPLKHRTAPGGR